MMTVELLLNQLKPDPGQPRKSMTDAAFESLVASIRERGLLLPLRVTPADASGNHVIVSGHRRHAALEKLVAKTAPCIIVEGPLDDPTILEEQIAENVHREDISPLDEALAYRRYLTLKDIPAARAAEELHVPAPRISRALALLDLPDDVQAAVHAGTIPKETGYYLSRLPAGEERNRLMAQALAGSLSRESAARAVKSSRSAATEGPAVTRVSCKLPNAGMLTLSGPAVKLESFIATLEVVLKEARKARAQGWDVSTLAKVFRDRAAKGGAA